MPNAHIHCSHFAYETFHFYILSYHTLVIYSTPTYTTFFSIGKNFAPFLYCHQCNHYNEHEHEHTLCTLLHMFDGWCAATNIQWIWMNHFTIVRVSHKNLCYCRVTKAFGTAHLIRSVWMNLSVCRFFSSDLVEFMPGNLSI